MSIRDCREFIVVSECECVHLSLSLLFFRAVHCLIQWERNEACRKLGIMSKGLFFLAVGLPIGEFMSCDNTGHGLRLEVGQRGIGCRHLCVHSLIFFFLVSIVSPPQLFMHS